MILILFLILGLIWGFARKGSFANIAQAEFKAWYLFAVSIILFLILHGGIAFKAQFLQNETTAYFLMLAAYIVLLVGVMLNLRGVNIWMIFMLLGAMFNFAVIFLNYGKMPYSQEALNIIGITAIDSPIKMLASETTSLNYLGGVIPIPIPFIAEVTSIGSVFVGIGIFGTVKNLLLGIVYLYEDEEYDEEENSSNYNKDYTTDDEYADEDDDVSFGKRGIKRKKRSATEEDESYYNNENSDEFVFGKDYTLGNISINFDDIPPEPIEPLSDDEFLDIDMGSEVILEQSIDSTEEPVVFVDKAELDVNADSIADNSLKEDEFIFKYGETKFETKEFEPIKLDFDDSETNEPSADNIVIDESTLQDSESSYSEDINNISEDIAQQKFEDPFRNETESTDEISQNIASFDNILNNSIYLNDNNLEEFEEVLSDDNTKFDESNFGEATYTYSEPVEEISLDEIIETVITSPLPRDLDSNFQDRSAPDKTSEEEDMLVEDDQQIPENPAAESILDPLYAVEQSKNYSSQPDYFDDNIDIIEQPPQEIEQESEEYDTASPFVIMSGRIVENPYYKFKRVSKNEAEPQQTFQQKNSQETGTRNPSLRGGKPSFNINQQQLKKNSDQNRRPPELQQYEKVEMKSGNAQSNEFDNDDEE